ncbi:MAG TPA: hypothetical protein DEP38_05040 [Cyanobacteria bacterium UBA9226]|nr:hypothetical protein [Cyanobacteria bacterium UBA9226]
MAPVAGIVLATGAVVVAGATVAKMGVKAVQAYQERVRREKEAAEKRELELQQRIAEIRARVRSNYSQGKIAVKLPDTVTNYTKVKSSFDVVGTAGKLANPEKVAVEKDAQRRIQEQKSRLPKIRLEYQALIEQQLLDEETVNQAIERTEQALNGHNLGEAEANLRALDDARIQVMQQFKVQWFAQIQYLQERLDGLRDRFPATVIHELQIKIDQVRNNLPELSDTDLQAIHQQISEFEAQAERVQEAAENLVNSWTEVGYIASLMGIDNGDAVIEVETHEGANTQMRVEFSGQQINLFGPPEESSSCAERTKEALQIFQEQGYYMEWETWDGEPVPDDWRQLYSVVSSQVDLAEDESVNSEIKKLSQRRQKIQEF